MFCPFQNKNHYTLIGMGVDTLPFQNIWITLSNIKSPTFGSE